MQKELQIFSMASVAGDMYKSRYDKANEKRKAAWKDLKANFVPGSARFKEFKATIEPEFKAAIQKAREEVQTEFDREFEELRETEIARVKTISPGSEKMMDILGRLVNIPISVDEFGYLVEQYGNHNYWVDRQLISLSVKNGIQECAVAPDITTKLGILDELKNNLYTYFEKYNGEVAYNTAVLVSDAAIQRLEKQYTNNYSGISLNAREAGKRIVVEGLNKLDSLEKSMYLANALRTSTPDVQEGILYEICKNHESIKENPNMRLSGVSSAIENFKKAEYEGMRRAERTIDRIQNEPKKYEQDTIIYQNLEDRHFLKAVRESGNDELKKAVRHQQEVKAAGEAKEKREAEAKSGAMANVGAKGE